MISEISKQYPSLKRRKSFAIITFIMAVWGAVAGCLVEYNVGLIADNFMGNVKDGTDMGMLAAGILGFLLGGMLCAGIMIVVYTFKREQKYIYLVLSPVFIVVGGVIGFLFYWIYDLVCLVLGKCITTAEEVDGAIKEAPPAVPRKFRSATVDNLRGMAMLMIIMVHIKGTQDYLGYSLLMMLYFSVPLYFLLSGYQLSASAAERKFTTYLWRRVKSLLIPYIVLFAISYLWTNTLYAEATGGVMFGFDVSWSQLLRAFLFAGEDLYTVAVVPPPLWFLHALFISSIIFYFIAKIKNKWILGALMMLLFMFSLPIQRGLGESGLWILKLLPPAMFFMVCGYACRKVQNWYQRTERKLESDAMGGENKSGKIINSFLAIGLLLVSLRVMMYGNGELWAITTEWYFPAVLLFTVGWAIIAMETNNRVLNFIGRNSLYYLGIHPLILMLPVTENLIEFLTKKGFDGLSAYVADCIIVVLLTSVAVLVVITVKNWIKSLILDWVNRRKESA